MKNGLFGSELQSFKTFAKRLQNHVVLCKKGLKKPYIEKKDKLLKSGGNANSEKTRWPIFRLNLKVPKT